MIIFFMFYSLVDATNVCAFAFSFKLLPEFDLRTRRTCLAVLPRFQPERLWCQQCRRSFIDTAHRFAKKQGLNMEFVRAEACQHQLPGLSESGQGLLVRGAFSIFYQAFAARSRDQVCAGLPTCWDAITAQFAREHDQQASHPNTIVA
ncbi:MAG: hypothetical protein AB8B51_21905 [Sedimentitalea sp.]